MSESQHELPPGGPETLLRVFTASGTGAGTAYGSMTTGEWMLGPDGHYSGGSLGVLLDNVLARPVFVHSPAGRWVVSTEISIDFCAEPAIDGSVLSATAEAVEITDTGGLALARVCDQNGRTIATATQRLRFSDSVPRAQKFQTAGSEYPGRFADLFGLSYESGHGTVFSSELIANPAGAAHGGILLGVSEVVGTLAAQSDEVRFTASSIRVNYVRSAPLDGPLEFTSRVLHAGRTLRVVEVIGSTGSGKPSTIATVVCMPASS